MHAAEHPGQSPQGSRPRVILLALLGAVAVHLAIQAGARALIVYRGFVDDPVLLERGSWLHHMNHHVAQFAIALALIAVLTRGRPQCAGLNLDRWRESLRLLTRGFFPLLFIGLMLGHALTPLVQGTPPARFAGGVRPLDLAGVLVFSWIVVGISEEVVFRGLFQTALARVVRGTASIFGVEVPVAGLLAAVVFTLAHVSFVPLVANARQLILALVLGIYYAVAYHRTGSLLAPVIAHNAVDGGIVTVEWLVAVAMRGGGVP